MIFSTVSTTATVVLILILQVDSTQEYLHYRTVVVYESVEQSHRERENLLMQRDMESFAREGGSVQAWDDLQSGVFVYCHHTLLLLHHQVLFFVVVNFV